MKTFRFENPKLHIIAWALYIGYEKLLYVSLGQKFGGFWNFIAVYSVNIAFFYFNAHVIFPNAAKNGKVYYLKLFLMICGELMLYILCKYFFLIFFPRVGIMPMTPVTNYQNFIIACVYRAMFLLGISTGYWFALSTYHNQKIIDDLENSRLTSQLENKELERTLLATENAYLKSQINPHFLFNTLNFLYNSIAKFSDKVADSVMTLSDIMRYALTKADEDGKVRLESEIGHIENFIKLNQQRFNQRLRIDFTVDGEPGELRIIPLVLITLVENVFKYGDLLNEGYPAKITVKINGQDLTFLTHNLKKKKNFEKGHGIGIKNITARLKMYHKYDLDIEENEQFYQAKLKIQL